MVWGLGQSRAGSGEVPGTGSEKAPLARLPAVPDLLGFLGPQLPPAFCCGGYYLSLFTTVHFAPKLVTSVFFKWKIDYCLTRRTIEPGK